MEDIQVQPTASDAATRSDEIAIRAYLIWEKEGRPAGRDFDHWLQAEAQLRSIAPPPQEETIVLRTPANAAPPQPRRKVARKSGNGQQPR